LFNAPEPLARQSHGGDAIFATKKTSEAEVYLSKRSQTTMYQTELNMKAASVVTPTAKKFILSLNWPFFYYG